MQRRAGAVRRLILVAALVCPAAAQEAAGTIHVNTRLVTLNVVVHDKSGNPVSGLSKEDFALWDEGRPQQIRYCNAVVMEPPATSEPPRPPGDIYTNALTRRGALPSVTVILFDTLNSRWTSQGYALHRLREFLRRLDAQERVALYVLGDKLEVLHDFTDDASDLVAAVRRHDARHDGSTAVAAAPLTDLDRFLDGDYNRYHFDLEGKGGPAARQAYMVAATRATNVALESIARHLAAAPGRKSLIWIFDVYHGSYLGELSPTMLNASTEGPPPPPDVSEEGQPLPGALGIQAERTVRLMNDAGIAIYPVGAAGLETTSLGLGSVANPKVVGRNSSPPDPGAYLTMRSMAQRTGGRAFYNRNDLETGVQQALADARVTYTLAYTPDHGEWNGEFRKIQVKTRRSGLTVLARGGYVALPDAASGTLRSEADWLRYVASDPLEATQFPLEVQLSAAASDSHDLLVTLHLDPRALLAQPSRAGPVPTFEVVLLQLNDKNAIVAQGRKGIGLDRQAIAEQSPPETAELRLSLQPSPGATVLWVILRDQHSSDLGSVRIPLGKYLATAAK